MFWVCPRVSQCARKASRGRHLGGILIWCPNHLNWLLLTLRSSGSTPSILQMLECLTVYCLVHKHKQQSEPSSQQLIAACSLGRTLTQWRSARGSLVFPQPPGASHPGQLSKRRVSNSSPGVWFYLPMRCVKVSPTISSRYCSTSRPSCGSLPTREVTFHIPRTSLWCQGSARIGPCLYLPPRCPMPIPADGGATRRLLHAVLSGCARAPKAQGVLHSQVWLEEGGPVSLLCTKFSSSFLTDSCGVCESLLVWPLPWDQFTLGDPIRS